MENEINGAKVKQDAERPMMPVLSEAGHVDFIPVRQYFDEQKLAAEKKRQRNTGLKRF